jgi:hypothetical protein
MWPIIGVPLICIIPAGTARVDPGMVISCFPYETIMFKNYYVRPVTVDRIRSTWIGLAKWVPSFSGIPRSRRLEG